MAILREYCLIIQVFDLKVYETLSGYHIEHIPSGKIRSIGDGVDMYHDLDKGITLSPGTDAFNQALDHDLTHQYYEWLEAYFPEVTEA